MPDPRTNPADSLEAFARLCAALDDPFADRNRTLAEHQLDDAGAARLQEMWMTRFGSDRTGALPERFAHAYQEERARVEGARSAREERLEPQSRAATRAPRSELDATGHAVLALTPALPFVPGTADTSTDKPERAAIAAYDNAPQRAAQGSSIDETAELSLEDPCPSVPFPRVVPNKS